MHTLLATTESLAFIIPGGYEWIILLVIGLLIFGRRLPEVGRGLGRSIVEFKKGIKGIEDEIDEEVDRADREQTERLETKKSQSTLAADEDESNPYRDVESEARTAESN